MVKTSSKEQMVDMFIKSLNGVQHSCLCKKLLLTYPFLSYDRYIDGIKRY